MILTKITDQQEQMINNIACNVPVQLYCYYGAVEHQIGNYYEENSCVRINNDYNVYYKCIRAGIENNLVPSQVELDNSAANFEMCYQNLFIGEYDLIIDAQNTLDSAALEITNTQVLDPKGLVLIEFTVLYPGTVCLTNTITNQNNAVLSRSFTFTAQ